MRPIPVTAHRRVDAAVGSTLAASPRGSCPPPQNSKDSQKCPPQRICGLVGNNCEYDADDDTNQRHEVSYTQGHCAPLLLFRSLQYGLERIKAAVLPVL